MNREDSGLALNEAILGRETMLPALVESPSENNLNRSSPPAHPSYYSSLGATSPLAFGGPPSSSSINNPYYTTPSDHAHTLNGLAGGPSSEFSASRLPVPLHTPTNSDYIPPAARTSSFPPLTYGCNDYYPPEAYAAGQPTLPSTVRPPYSGTQPLPLAGTLPATAPSPGLYAYYPYAADPAAPTPPVPTFYPYATHPTHPAPIVVPPAISHPTAGPVSRGRGNLPDASKDATQDASAATAAPAVRGTRSSSRVASRASSAVREHARGAVPLAAPLAASTAARDTSASRSRSRVNKRDAGLDMSMGVETSAGARGLPAAAGWLTMGMAMGTAGGMGGVYDHMGGDDSTDSDGDDGDASMDKAKARLARKAELARASRKRKKQYVKDLEDQVQRLSEKVHHLKAQLSTTHQVASGVLKPSLADAAVARAGVAEVLPPAREDGVAGGSPLPPALGERYDPMGVLAKLEDEMVQDRAERVASLKQEILVLVQQDKVQPLAKQQLQRLQQLLTAFVAANRSTQPLCEYHLTQAEDCVEPSLQIRFAMWGLSQPEEFYEAGSEPRRRSMWASLMLDEIQLSPEQVARIKDHMAGARAEKREMLQCRRELSLLRERLAAHHSRLNVLMDEMMSIYTPTQLAQYYMWVERNAWSLSTLQQNDVDAVDAEQADTGAPPPPAE